MIELGPISVARVCYEALRTLQTTLGEPPLPTWAEAPEWLQQSMVDGVQRSRAGQGPGALHEAWVEHKKALGWVYGPVKDQVAQTHPFIVPFEDLPAQQALKDHLFVQIVEVLSPIPRPGDHVIVFEGPESRWYWYRLAPSGVIVNECGKEGHQNRTAAVQDAIRRNPGARVRSLREGEKAMRPTALPHPSGGPTHV